MSGILVHEWLARFGGSENVFEVLSETFPDAERFCLWNDSDGRFTGVNETILARTPLRRSKAAALPFMPAVWRHLPRRDADWVLCSSHLFAHHARFGGPARDAVKLVYAHTPARYIWTPELDGRGDRLLARAVAAPLKPLDRRRAAEPVSIVANSAFVAQRIADTWERVCTLGSTLSAKELLEVEPEVVFRRLFWQENVQHFEPTGARFQCSCSREKVGAMLRMLGRDEVDSVIVERGHVEIHCEFCNQRYEFDPVDVAQLFAAPELATGITPATEQRH